MALKPIAGTIVLVAGLIAAWTWLPSARVLHGGLENNLGYLYLHGIVVTRDARQAIAWYTRAAERGLAMTEYNLAYLDQSGDDIAPNPRMAAYWYERAASEGHAESANNLAMMYADGSLGTRDLPRARVWLKRTSAFASPEFAPVPAANLQSLEHDMSADQLARSESLLAALPHAR